MIRRLALSILLIAGFSSLCLAQSLGDAAREARKNKRPSSSSSRVYTNETVSGSGYRGSVSTTGTATDADANSKEPEKKEAGDGAAKPAEGDAASEEERKKAAEELKTKLLDAQKELSQLQRELDVMQRENRMRTAQFYADAGARLRDEKKYAEEDRQTQSNLAAKQKAVADRQQVVNDLQEQMRRLGLR